MTSKEKKEIDEVKKVVASLKRKPRAITPIVFPLHLPLPLSNLVSPHSVNFDLDGDGIKERWQWVNSQAAFLVWDGERTGKVNSGLQLFGSVTWWTFWRNGYEALAALDDDGNGWLEGKELDGIFVWHDKDSNGVSERGEVLPPERFKIVRISVKATHCDSEVLFNPKGIQFYDGHFLPTCDWGAKTEHLHFADRSRCSEVCHQLWTEAYSMRMPANNIYSKEQNPLRTCNSYADMQTFHCFPQIGIDRKLPA